MAHARGFLNRKVPTSATAPDTASDERRLLAQFAAGGEPAIHRVILTPERVCLPTQTESNASDRQSNPNVAFEH